MEYSEKLFEKVATGRIKKFYDSHKEAFFARAIDFKDLQQEMRIAIWQKMQKYESLAEEEYIKLINKILTTKLIDAKQLGYKHMKTDDMTIEEENEEKLIQVHNPKFLNIDAVDEKSLIDSSDYDKSKAKVKLDFIKSKLNHLETALLECMLDGKTEDEMACQQICCKDRRSCELSKNPNKFISKQGNIGKQDYRKNCKEFNKLFSQSMQINRLKKRLVSKVKKIANNMLP